MWGTLAAVLLSQSKIEFPDRFLKIERLYLQWRKELKVCAVDPVPRPNPEGYTNDLNDFSRNDLSITFDQDLKTPHSLDYDDRLRETPPSKKPYTVPVLRERAKKLFNAMGNQDAIEVAEEDSYSSVNPDGYFSGDYFVTLRPSFKGLPYEIHEFGCKMHFNMRSGLPESAGLWRVDHPRPNEIPKPQLTILDTELKVLSILEGERKQGGIDFLLPTSQMISYPYSKADSRFLFYKPLRTYMNCVSYGDGGKNEFSFDPVSGELAFRLKDVGAFGRGPEGRTGFARNERAKIHDGKKWRDIVIQSDTIESAPSNNFEPITLRVPNWIGRAQVDSKARKIYLALHQKNHTLIYR